MNVSYMRVWWKQRHQKEEEDGVHASDLSQINRHVHHLPACLEHAPRKKLDNEPIKQGQHSFQDGLSA